MEERTEKLGEKNLSILSMPKRKEWPQREQLARTPEPSFSKGKGTEHQIIREKRVKVGESLTLASERGIRARAWGGKGGLHRERRQIPRRRGRASNKSLPRTSRRKHERVSGRKSSPGRSAESWFHS